MLVDRSRRVGVHRSDAKGHQRHRLRKDTSSTEGHSQAVPNDWLRLSPEGQVGATRVCGAGGAAVGEGQNSRWEWSQSEGGH